jgi:predicted nucleic acid-binding protein
MAQYVVDTNVLLRAADATSAQHDAAIVAISTISARDENLFLAPQVLMELWSVATRPIEVNGFGWTVEQARTKIIQLLREFPLLPETSPIFDEWLRLVTSRRVVGKKAHDARLVALMKVHNITHLLTFNTRDFQGYSITAVSPDDISRP